MKKSILAIVFVVAIVLVGCSDFSHEHSWKETFRVDDTTTGEGEIVYVCIGCGEIVSKKAFLVKDEVELKNAIAVADASKPIYILADISLTSTVEIKEGQVVEINLNGKTISAASMPFLVRHGNVSFVGTGVIQETESDNFAAILIKGSETDVENYSVVTVGKDITLKGWSGIFVDQLSSKQGKPQAYGVVVNMYGKIVVPAESSHVAGHGIYVNGAIKDIDGNVPTFNIEGANIVARNTGIYAAGYAKWNIKDTTIEGVETAIEIRAGELNIESGEYSASATPTAVAPNGNGTTSSGAAIAVAQHTTKLPISVNISGGVFKGYSALYESNPQKNDADGIAKVKLNVTGGSFASTASDKKCAVYSEDCIGFIVGGTYNSDPTAYVAEGYKASESEGVWNVVAE